MEVVRVPGYNWYHLEKSKGSNETRFMAYLDNCSPKIAKKRKKRASEQSFVHHELVPFMFLDQFLFSKINTTYATGATVIKNKELSETSLAARSNHFCHIALCSSISCQTNL